MVSKRIGWKSHLEKATLAAWLVEGMAAPAARFGAGFLLQQVFIAFEAPVPAPILFPVSFRLLAGLLEQEWDKNSHFTALCSFCRFWSMCEESVIDDNITLAFTFIDQLFAWQVF